MSYFLNREDDTRGGRQPVGGRSNAGRPPPVPGPSSYTGNPGPLDHGSPGSPLSRLVQQGYVPGGMLNDGTGGFDAGVAQQWNSNVQQTTAQHQQQNDPNYVQKSVKSNGYRVSHAPGGGSSISLSWDEAPNGAVDPGRRGRGAGAGRSPDHAVGGAALRGGGGGGMAGCLGGGAWGAQDQPQRGGDRQNYRTASPSAGGRGVAGLVRSNSREAGGMAGCLGGGGAPQSHPSSRGSERPGAYSAAYDSRAAPYGGGAGGNLPAPQQQPRGRQQSEGTSLSFGNRVEHGSSNAYACGANQNCGNGITDRRTTRVLAPPGGASQISFG